MKRIFVLSLVLVLVLTAFSPCALFSSAEVDPARLGEILTALSEYDNFASGQVLTLLEEAESLLDYPEVVAAYSQEDLDKVPLYRRYYHRDCTLAEIKSRLSHTNRTVSFSSTDVRRYAEREWSAVLDAYSEAKADVELAATLDDMTGIRTHFFDTIRTFPVYDEVYDAWTLRVEETVNQKIAFVVAKVNAYRAGENMPALAAPVFSANRVSDGADDFQAFTSTHLSDAAAVNAAFSSCLSATLSLGLYAASSDMEACWADYDAAASSATPVVPAAERTLTEAKRRAVETLRAAIEGSAYVQSLTGTDYALYLSFPDLLEHDLAEAESVEEVQAALDGYLSLLEPETIEKPKAKKNVFTILIIVFACISGALFIAYFVLRFARGTGGRDAGGADKMLAELERLSSASSPDSPDAALPSADEGSPPADTSMAEDAAPAGEDGECSTDTSLPAESSTADDDGHTDDTDDVGDTTTDGGRDDD